MPWSVHTWSEYTIDDFTSLEEWKGMEVGEMEAELEVQATTQISEGWKWWIGGSRDCLDLGNCWKLKVKVEKWVNTKMAFYMKQKCK